MADSTNRIGRITFMVSSTKTSANVVHPEGSLNRYDKPRTDTVEPANIHFVERNRYITRES
jgi:hypothetical protein